MQVSAKDVTAEYVVHHMQDPLDLLGLRRGPVSRLPRHDSRLDTPTRRAMREDQAARATYPSIHPTRQVTLITGGSSGMGLVTAQAFAEAGAAVIFGRRRQRSVGTNCSGRCRTELKTVSGTRTSSSIA
jgi:hypothetical protein